MRREARARVGDQLVGAGGRSGGDDERRSTSLPPLAIVAAGDGNLGHAGMLEQGRLDALRPDVLAAADDQVVAAALDPEVSLVVEAAEVAGVQPAVAGERRRGDRGTADEDLALARPRTSVPGSGRPAEPTRAPASPGPSVQTCEQASVRP